MGNNNTKNSENNNNETNSTQNIDNNIIDLNFNNVNLDNLNFNSINCNIDQIVSMLSNVKVTNENFLMKNDKDNVVIKCVKNNDDETGNTYKITWYTTNEEQIIDKSNISQYTIEVSNVINNYNDKLIRNYGTNIYNSGKGFIYTRASSANDLTIDDQKKQCLSYAERNKFQLHTFGFHYDNGVSARNGTNFKKGEIGFWHHYLNRGDILIVNSIDRLSRSVQIGTQFLNSLADRGIEIHFVTENIVWKQNMSPIIKSSILTQLVNAQMDSDLKSQKAKNRITRLKLEGHDFGPCKYGYKKVRVNNIFKKIIDKKEQKNITFIKTRFLKHRSSGYFNVKQSLESIKDELINNKIYDRKDKPFTTSRLNYIIKKL